MQSDTYNIILNSEYSYTFISDGDRGKILKAVVFQEIEKSLFNLALLDYDEVLENWSDISNTNNNDIIRTMKTVLTIIIDFVSKNPNYFVAVKANTEIKLLLYNRIFKNYYKEYMPEIVVLMDSEIGKIEANFDKIHKTFYICKKPK